MNSNRMALKEPFLFFSTHSVVLEPVFLPSQATIFTLSTLISFVTSLNSTSFNTKVHMLSQNLYIFREPLKLTRFLTLCANAAFTALSNWSRTWRASWGVICWDCISSSRLSWRLFPNVVFLYNWYAMAEEGEILFLIQACIDVLGNRRFPPRSGQTWRSRQFS